MQLCRLDNGSHTILKGYDYDYDCNFYCDAAKRDFYCDHHHHHRIGWEDSCSAPGRD